MDFTKHPFGLPATNDRNKKINRLLAMSYRLQKQDNMSNACAYNCIILQRCLEAMAVEARLVYGYIKFPGLNVPHVWLIIDGHLINNTWAEGVSESQNSMLFTTQRAEFVAMEPNENGDFFLGDDYTRNEGLTTDHNIGHFKWILAAENRNKALAISENAVHIRNYHTDMRNFVKSEFDVETLGLVPVDECWHCGEQGMELKKCSSCKVAKYCGKKCQKDDWRTNHNKASCLRPNFEPFPEV